jgi:tetratricopeptide (TPR) repeat protein
VNNAEQLSPDYFEVYRVKALIQASRGNVTEARTAYEGAIELKPDHPPLRLWYGGFLMRYMQDVEGALAQLQEAHRLDPKSSEIQVELARANLYLKHFDDAKKLLDSLLSRSDLGVWQQRQLHDLRIQFFHRLTEHRLLQHDDIGALSSLEGIRQEYELCPVELRDDKMCSRLEKAVPAAIQCLRVATNPQSIRQGNRLLDWLKVQAGVALAGANDVQGIVLRIHSSGEFGFIRGDDGNEYYFNVKATRYRAQRGQIREGERVSFILSANEVGTCAVRVALI